jgi:hypothetical protein
VEAGTGLLAFAAPTACHTRATAMS